jgi:hypothetical protein
LLILGGMTACERAHPVVDARERPAVGNIGQTGQPAPTTQTARPAAIAMPLADAEGTPAVGNIGQTGRPATPAPPRRVQRAQRAHRSQRPPAAQLAVQSGVASPLVDSRERPAVGNVSGKRAMEPRTDLAVQTAGGVPLVDRRERPAVGNVMRKNGPGGALASLAQHIAQLEEDLRVATTEEKRTEIRANLALRRADYQRLRERGVNP